MTSAIWETERGTILKVNVRPKSREKNLVAEISPEVKSQFRTGQEDGKGAGRFFEQYHSCCRSQVKGKNTPSTGIKS